MKTHKKPAQTAPRRGLPAWTIALLAAGALSSSAQAQIQTAGDLLVSVDSTASALGAVASIPNTGTLAGVFVATGAAADQPVVRLIGGTKALDFDGTDFLQLADAVGGSLILPPTGIVGESPTRSIEVWALNPAVAGEETLVSWGKRGGPDGSNVSFGYGNDFRWGAIGHWGGDGPDLGWNNDGGNPPPNKWHHLVYTFDGTTSRVYADGALANAEVVNAGIINTHPDTSINIAAQLEADGTTVTGGLRFTGAIARVRIHDEVLTPAQILANYNLEKAAFIDPTPPTPPAPIVSAPISKAPTHRYSFSEAADGNATDKEFKDSIGTAHGTVRGDGAAFSGTRLVLAGGPSATAAFGDLPNGLLSVNSADNGGSGAVTIETWMKVTGSQNWSRVFDFGSSTSDPDNEVIGPGGGGTGLDYLTLSAQIGGDTGNRRLEVRNEDPAGGGVATADSGTSTFGNDFNVALTWVEATGRLTLFENGRELTGLTINDKLSDMNDVNVWLGRSNWNGDSNTQGEYDEVRIYDYALTPAQALGTAYAGPNLVVPTQDVPVTIATPPASQSAFEGRPVTFSVAPRGSSPIAIQWLRNGVEIPGAISDRYTIAAVSAADNGAAFSVRVSNGSGATATTITTTPVLLTLATDTVTLKHRYSFSESAGTVIDDSVGTANGTLVGTGTLGGGKLALDGTDGYVNLPNGIISALGDNGTFEVWFTYDGGPNWARIFDFGTQADGEDGTGTGLDFLTFTPKTAQGFGRFFGNFPAGGDLVVLSTPGSTLVGEEFHLAITYSFSGNTTRIYTNGTQVAVGSAPRRLSQLTTDVNNWLGKSQFPADPNVTGKYNEFRIYQGGLTPAQVAASFAAGPDTLPTTPANPVQLAAARSGDDLTVTWTGGNGPFLVQTSAALGTSWLDTLTTANRTVTIPLVGAAGFVRIIDGTTKNIQLFKAHLDSQQEPNKPVSNGKGAGIAVLDGLNLTYYVSYEGLGSGVTGAHIHNAAVGVNGPVFVPFSPVVGSTSGIITGTATLTAAQKVFIETGVSYFNIHTSVNGGGEIRGQILP